MLKQRDHVTGILFKRVRSFQRARITMPAQIKRHNQAVLSQLIGESLPDTSMHGPAVNQHQRSAAALDMVMY